MLHSYGDIDIGVVLAVGGAMPSFGMVATRHDKRGRRRYPFAVVGLHDSIACRAFFINHNKHPWLAVAGRGGQPSGIDDSREHVAANRLPIVVAAGIACRRQFVEMRVCFYWSVI